ncbi:MAG: ATP-binding cassette domain-containing protein [Deltaproteobacteria bacterium]|jgi:phospholipid/cholesterol/gamma-HCH transport system ATP-binding protein|nr:ATP-binding cassette domain-containing protein [Deltaproteobacteria bacterium]
MSAAAPARARFASIKSRYQAPGLTVRKVSKSFGGREVLKEVSLDILPAAINFIIGRSGEGKSVLLKILTGLYQADSGSIMYGDLDLAKASPKDWRRIRLRMGVLFQDGALFDSMSLGQNVCFPLWFHGLANKREARLKAEELLGELGLEEAYDVRVSELSIGERKRVALARALAVDPEAVFFDEPTTGLDPLLSAQVDELIVHAQKKTGGTVVVVSHDMAATLSLAANVTLLRQGRAVYSGPPEGLLTSSDEEARRFLAAVEIRARAKAPEGEVGARKAPKEAVDLNKG